MKKYIITGAATGLGFELAKLYGKEGMIILVGRRKEELLKAAKELNSMGIEAKAISCDISNYDEVLKLKDEIKKDYGSIDYLINNAGVGCFGALGELSKTDIDKAIDINVKGTIYITQMLLPFVKERILNIISTAGLRGKVNETVYCASKFAVRGFTEALQKESQGKEFKVTGVYMGGMNTPFWDTSSHVKDKSRLKSPYDIAKVIKEYDDGREEIIIES
ncbi:SDR family NAD(P)-dependent oxidoreductase [Desnuesiella massiliensis]|uniref:SDR family NAD(P)-dependent oxidoreductase n=1 Tax=Desnuesiella massiliensis TaxID=1650662 RepID=UPI0006E456E3|nr:SDR family oxidoreductase [Desnuesiella massiliensis]